jgi:Flp pilus assembly protein TadG
MKDFLWACRQKMADDSGMSTIEIVLIIVILIALVLMFKNTIVEFVSNVLSKIASQGSIFDPSSVAG